jgi:hypothetical protein
MVGFSKNTVISRYGSYGFGVDDTHFVVLNESPGIVMRDAL